MGGYYRYDAWGQIVTMDAASTPYYNALNANPLRYRGYIYDSETEFYYLQSRYYDPAVRRFINADGYVSTGTGTLGYNMFAYCNNNPVINVDSTGESLTAAIIIISVTALIGTIVGGVIEYNEAVENNQDDDPTNDENIVLETLKGMAKGFTAGSLLGGAIVSTGGVFAGVAGCTFLGTAPLQAYSFGAAVFNIATYVVPLFVDPSEDVNTEQIDPVIPGSNNYVPPPLQ